MICFLPLKFGKDQQIKFVKMTPQIKDNRFRKLSYVIVIDFKVYEFSLSILMSTEIEDVARSLC